MNCLKLAIMLILISRISFALTKITSSTSASCSPPPFTDSESRSTIISVSRSIVGVGLEFEFEFEVEWEGTSSSPDSVYSAGVDGSSRVGVEVGEENNAAVLAKEINLGGSECFVVGVGTED